MQKDANMVEAVHDFLGHKGWLQLEGPEQVTFLAAGEYNENYLIVTEELYGESRHVLRINHGSQLGLDDQIAYEFTVLQALVRSGVTPRPYFCDPEPDDERLGNGVLLMEYLDGRPLDYARDTDVAAGILAAVHAQPVDARLLTQRNPVRDIVRESEGLISRYPDHPMQREQKRLLDYRDSILSLAEETDSLFADEPLVMVNTEVNSHNFIIAENGRGWLVDWEKAVISSRYQDLGHFLVETTTRWKRDHAYSREEKRAFVAEYLERGKLDISLDEAVFKTSVLERTILLRALSWCFMAWHEYSHGGRALENPDTFDRIRTYLDEMECFFTHSD